MVLPAFVPLFRVARLLLCSYPCLDLPLPFAYMIPFGFLLFITAEAFFALFALPRFVLLNRKIPTCRSRGQELKLVAAETVIIAKQGTSQQDHGKKTITW